MESVLGRFSAKNAFLLTVFRVLVFQAKMSDYIMVKSSDKFMGSSVEFYGPMKCPTSPYPPPTPGCRVLLKTLKIIGDI